MSARIPARRLGQAALSAPKPWLQNRSLSTTAPLQKFLKKDEPATPPDYSNPILANVLAQEATRLQKETDSTPTAPKMSEGALNEKTSLFHPNAERMPGWHNAQSEADKAAFEAKVALYEAEQKIARDKMLSSIRLDPDPKARMAWERDMVIKGVQRRGRLTKDLVLKRTEREYGFRSQDLPGSVKKLTKLMNQIQGKTIEEALVQMRFSKKKVARDIVKGLQIARNKAIVERGMGLGSAGKIVLPPEVRLRKELGESDLDFDARVQAAEKERDAEIQRLVEKMLPAGTYRSEKGAGGVEIELKDGSKKVVYDPTEIYVDQAWVGKGGMYKSPEYRARGRINMLQHRTTSFSVVLKEEKTRMRISEEIKKKRDERPLWTALPDRVVSKQRQFCLW